MTDAPSISIMLCTRARGGMRSVVEAYERDGIFARNNTILIYTHDEGGGFVWIPLALRALLKFSALAITRHVSSAHVHIAMRGSFWRKSIFCSLARALSIPVILHLHGSQFELFYDEQPRWRKRLIRSQFESAYTVLVLSESWRTFVQRVAPEAHVVILPNYVHASPAERTLPNSSDVAEISVLFLGLLGPRKGIYDLLQAWRQVCDFAPGAILNVGGNGEIDKVKQTVTELGLDNNVNVLGWIAGTQKDAALHAADIFVLPSYNEGLPISLLEAMGLGVPVISTTVGGIPELIEDGETGILVEPGDAEGLAESLLRLLRDPQLRVRIGEAGRRRVQENYSADSVLPRLQQVYDRARRVRA